ncbi:MAG TPA: PLP-dependent aminotransferase family protein [Azospirillaceae bacterium]|nr:PLP-dependent aminotransferase family protein [Azospirillaceae bacterium]
MPRASRPASGAHKALPLQIALDKGCDEPIQAQLCRQFRALILSGALPPGTQLPSSRLLAQELGCSRTPVLMAIEQLVAEGFVVTRDRSGIEVAADLPQESRPAGAVQAASPAIQGLSMRGERLAMVTSQFGVRYSSSPGHAAVEGFPFELWGKLAARVWRHPASSVVWTDSPAGYPPLREALAEHVRVVRGLPCTADQIIITTGTRSAADMVGRILLDAGDEVALEDPGWPGWAVLESVGQKLTRVPVDAEGIDVEQLQRLAPAARMAAVTPSHQFPLGPPMSLQRRLALLNWAREGGRWILEDDYDSEFRYSGAPLATLCGLDGGRNVLYIGTFSKAFFPSLRMGYLIVPRDLAPKFAQARAAIDVFPSVMQQPVLAAFIAEGHLARHIRTMRRLYGLRYEVVRKAFEQQFGDEVEVIETATGLSLTVVFRRPMNDLWAAERARALGFYVYPLSVFYFDRPAQSGLVVGLNSLPEEMVHASVGKLRAQLRDTAPA